MPERVLIVDQRTTYPLQLCQALARGGHEIHAVAERGSALLASRHCARVVPTPPWYADEAYFEEVSALVEDGRYDVIYIASEVLLERLVPFVKRSSAWRAFPFPPADVATVLFDKNAVLERVAAAGVPVPRSIVPETAADVPAAGRELGFPLVVKGAKGAAAQNVRIVHAPADLPARFAEVQTSERRYAGRPAVQQFIAGPTYLVGGVFDAGRPLRIAAQRKVHMYPAAGGATVKGISERPPRLIAHALRAFAALRYTGLGSLDFLLDPRDGEFRFLEINPRPWATLGLALQCTDLLGAYHALAQGRPVVPDLSFREGVRWHRLSGELRLIRERPSRLPGFLLDCLDPRVGSDFDWRDLLAPVHAVLGRDVRSDVRRAAMSLLAPVSWLADQL